ncbi:ribosome biogenesis GTP-binding protein YihA/YsxC [Acetivibrio straminisolvens]|jgi:GTP-binding protein|uniref:ribosome biogenesis GTP-binding protein YihA/YsxC n=1 Tax=Acetivibrio straminisolvens TaxID=253314 RepID=UPI00223E937E|nr:ribosome biogenesis GTP-binding protein YihA/YsxC [Acetivibrio straminisolvens]
MKLKLNLNNARFEITAVKPDQYPKNDIPEITFVGRSNVGKSSLINAMLNRKNLAKVAATPGRTRVINFYNIDDKIYFVDLPGYGFAKVSKSMKSGWKDLIETYLTEREQLRKVVMLVDIRHSPTSDDVLMHEWLKTMKRSYVVVATKLDKIPRSKIKERLSDIRNTLKLRDDVKIISFSSETKQGRDELWEEILEESSFS